MKKIVYLIIYTTLLLTFSNSFASDIEYNTDSNIKKAILVEDYIIRHKEKIENFLDNYDIKDNKELNNDLKILNDSIIAIRKIQNTDIEKKKAEDIIQNILNRIKTVNENLKVKLKIEKELYEKKLDQKKQAYSLLWKKISDKIYNINLKLARNILKDKQNLSFKELQIKNNLINLNKESQRLKNFWDMEFKSEYDIKETFINILKNIKNEINLMNKVLNNKD